MIRQKPKRAAPLVPKRLGESMVKKGPPRSPQHIALVKEQPCLVTGAKGREIVAAHHAKGLFPRTAYVRISDYLAVPLAHRKHTLFADSLHEFKEGNEVEWWRQHGIDPLSWMENFLRSTYGDDHEDSRAAIRMIERERIKNGPRD